MIVSISRELGAGGRSIGEAIAAALGAPLLDEHAVIDELSPRLGLPADFLAEHVERAPSRGERLISDLAAATAMVPYTSVWQQPDEIIIEGVRELVLEYAARGHVVVIGFGGPALLGLRAAGTPMLSILLRASRAWRVDQLASRYGIDHDEAEARIERTDEARRRYQKHYFNTDLYDSRQYDLVLCTESLGLEQAVAIATNVAAARAPAAPRG
ncbi:MAG TPA: cytidylate kinase-like family protein [Candidatus Acidoferrum sp.]|nr:cytidylate kinase-like family protein [Candidatus Acidoferrum sp.]